jgi:hypothetical protein
MSIKSLRITDAFLAPEVTILRGSRTIADTDDIAGESVSFTATTTGIATNSDGTIATTQWLVDGAEVATGLNATIALPNGSTVVTFKATDNDGSVYSASVDIKIKAQYVPSSTWPAPFNGVSPNSSLSLALNNIGVYEASTGLISSCISVYTNGEASDADAKFDILFNLLNDSSGDIQYANSRAFNAFEKLAADEQAPDCSGRYETTTNVFSDTIETRLITDLFGVSLPINKTFNVSFQLIDAANLIFRLLSYEELVAP